MKNLVIVVFLLVLFCSCAENARWKTNLHQSRDQFRMDHAACKIESSRAYNETQYSGYRGTSTTTNYSGTYHRPTGYYSGTATTTNNEHWSAPIAEALVKGSSAERTFETCMVAKGYFIDNSSSRADPVSDKYNKPETGPCSTSLDCALGFYCDDGSCRNRADAERKRVKKN